MKPRQFIGKQTAVFTINCHTFQAESLWVFFHHMSLMDFVDFPPGCDQSVTDFWDWDAHEAQLRCPDEVDGDIWIWSTRRSLKPVILNYPDNGHHGDLPLQGKIPMARTGNRTRDLMISSNKLWPLDHEAGLTVRIYQGKLLYHVAAVVRSRFL
jgi:hypothetical protein